jgi:GGDEF domain-containing protein
VIVERLHSHLAHFNSRSSRPYKLSLSYGVAHFDPGGSTTSLEDVVRLADQAMYEQKRSKRK